MVMLLRIMRLLRRLMLLLRIMLVRLLLIRRRKRAAGLFHDRLVEPLPDRNAGAARGFTCGVTDFRPDTFHVPRDALPHAITQTRPWETNP